MNYLILNESIIISRAGRLDNISNTDSRYEKILTAIRENRLDDIGAIVDELTTVFGDNKRLSLIDGLVHIDDKALPEELSKRVLDFKEKKLPFDFLLKFWDNLKLNPSFNSRKMLYKFLEHNGHPITQDGCFIAYRGVTNDFKDPHTKTFDNSVGAICEVDRSEVDDNPDNTCSYGLHVASYKYAHDFSQVTVEVKVNPKDVVAVPNDYNGTKMRVCKFEVLAIAKDERNETVYNEEEILRNYDDDDDDDDWRY